MSDYYNDFDAGACAWLGELMAEGHIPAGRIDSRSILDVRPDDLAGARRAHFFAGIGGWAEALRLSGWEGPVWTGSPPCQPFSAAGQRRGRDDERHLGPAFVELVRACRPPVLFGEQVASAEVVGRAASGAKRGAGGEPAWAWCDDLFVRLEAAGYACGAAVVPACGVGAPHIRARLFFGAVRVADADDAGLEGRRQPGRERAAERPAGPRGVAGGLADADGRDASAEGLQRGGQHRQQPQDRGAGGMANTTGARGRGGQPMEGWRHDQSGRPDQVQPSGRCGASSGHASPLHGFWRDADWLGCRDGKWRPVEPGIQPLAHGVSGRVGLLRGAGNAIVPQAAAAFIRAFRESIPAMRAAA